MKSFLLGSLFGAVVIVAGLWVALGPLTGDAKAAPSSSGLWADLCIYDVKDISAYVNYPYGSVKYVQAVALNTDGRYLSDEWARSAAASFDCQRYGF